MATLDSLVNTQLGQYQIMTKLGQGGMATVFKAHEQSLNRVVALKVLHPSLAENEEYIKRFKREAQSAAKLNHPNIVHIYAIGEDRGYHYFAMELIKGESLADYKRNGKKLDTERILSITRQIAGGLDAAHEAGLVHRDIKPSNIMLLGDGSVKVADFGIAQVSSGETKLTMDGAVIGTPEYLSPEQCEGHPIDGRSDIYSLGVTLYELLSGKTPYSADTPVGMLMKIVKGEHPPLGSIVPDIPAEIENLVKRMMATKPDQRFQSCRELITAIDAIQPKKATMPPVEPLMTTVNPKTRVQKKKGKGWLALAAVLVLALGVGAAMYFDLIPAPWKKTDEPTRAVSALGALNPGQESVSPADAAAADDPSPDEDAAAASADMSQSPQDSGNTVAAGQEPAPADTQDSGNLQPEATEFNTETSGAAQVSNQTQAASQDPPVRREPATYSRHLHLLIKEENEHSELILTTIEEKLIGRGIDVIRGEPDDSRPYMALIVSFRTVGVSSLQYYGHTSQQTQAFLTLSLLDLPSRRPLDAPRKEEVLFTELNMAENIDEAVDKTLAGFDWQKIIQRRRQLTRNRMIRSAIRSRITEKAH